MVNNNEAKKPRVIIHMDINKTIIIKDTASKKSEDMLVNQTIMQNIFGKISKESQFQLTKKENETEFEFVERCFSYYSIKYVHPLILKEMNTKEKSILSTKKVISCSMDSPIKKEKIYSLDHFLSDYMYPYVDSSHKDKEYVYRNNQIAKRKRNFVFNHFMEFKFSAIFKTLQKKMMKSVSAFNNQKTIKKNPERSLSFSIIPNFFNLVAYLEEQNFEYSVVFRTFGNDIEEVVTQWNRFCNGEHEDYPNFYNPSKKLNIYPCVDISKFGYFWRTNSGDVQLVLGSVGLDNANIKKKDFSQKLKLDENQENVKPKKKIVDGKKEIYEYINKHCKVGSTLFFRDLYEFWNINGEYPKFGKLFLIDEDDTSVFQMFFDDNVIYGSGRGIVDLQNIKGNHLNIKENLDKYLAAVNPLRSILEPYYFIEKFQKGYQFFQKNIQAL